MTPVLQYVSDLHLEARRKWPYIPARAPVLLLAGDIGSPKKDTLREFMADVSSRFKMVLYVPGNHEYFGNVMSETEVMLQKVLAPFPNVIYLKDRSITLEDVFERPIRVVGTTMWAPCPASNHDLRDFQKIFLGEPVRRFRSEDMRALHQQSVEFLSNELGVCRDVDTVVVTHHGPMLETNGAFMDHPASEAYAADMRGLMHDHVRAWVYGHTHINMSVVHNNCLVTTNALGYPGENVPGFRPVALIEL